MEIKEGNLKFLPCKKRVDTNHILAHHRAGNGDLKSIHEQHLKQGWVGIGYHYYVRKNGEIWRGRPQWAVGSHCPGRNSDSIGICFEGDFQSEKMGEIQLKAGLELVEYLAKQVYPGAKIGGHFEHYATACPGKNFPLGLFKELGK